MLAAIIIDAVVFGMIDIPELRRLYRVTRFDFWIAVAAILGVLSAGVLAGVVIGIALSLGWLVYVATRPAMPLLGREPGTQVFRDIDENPDDETFPGIVVLRLDGGLFFATAEALEDRIRELIDARPPLRALVLDLEGVNFVDSQGAAKLTEILELHEADDVSFGWRASSRRCWPCCEPTASSIGSAPTTSTATSTARFRQSSTRPAVSCAREPRCRSERGHPGARGASRGGAERGARSARAGVRPDQRVVGAASRRGPELLPADPRRHRRRSSSVHINQFGFRPGLVGDRFAEALIAKAREGVSVRLIVDRQGTDPERGSKELYERLAAAGIVVCVNRATQPRALRGPIGSGGGQGWNLSGLGHIDHRKVVVVDGRIGWVGGAGIEDHFEDGQFHDLFVRVEGPVVAQLQLVFVASLRWLGGTIPAASSRDCSRRSTRARAPCPPSCSTTRRAVTGRSRPRSRALIDGASDTLDIVNPYVTDRGMIGRIVRAAQRGARVRLFVPANPNNWACGAAEQFHHRRLLDAGVQLLGYPQMLHAKAFLADGEHVLAGTCNLEAWSLKRFFEIDIGFESTELAAQFEDRFLAPAEEVSSGMQPPSGLKERARATAFAALSPLL